MRGVDTSINNITAGSGASSLVVDIARRSAAMVGDTGQSPCRARLRDVVIDAHDRVLLDKLDLYFPSVNAYRGGTGAWQAYVRVILESLNFFGSEGAGETLEARGCIDVVGLSGHGGVESVYRVHDGIVVHLDDVLALDQVVTCATRNMQRRGRGALRRGREGRAHQGKECKKAHDGSFGGTMGQVWKG